MTGKFPVDALRSRAIKAFEIPSFRLVREAEHIAMARDNPDRTKIPLTMPGHARIKSSTLRAICTKAGISRKDFLDVYRQT